MSERGHVGHEGGLQRHLAALLLRRDGHIGPRFRHGGGTGDVELARLGVEHDVGLVGLEQRCCDLLGFLDDLDRRLVDR